MANHSRLHRCLLCPIFVGWAQLLLHILVIVLLKQRMWLAALQTEMLHWFVQVRAGRGWMFWRVAVSLTEAGEGQVEHVVATIFRSIQARPSVFCRCM
jgi:hypothetical protein